ncbi:LPD7 domain-containing protein [Candidatus Hamiltonella endosymbiont of Tuberolachnus salignus]|uniref:LPD7 domain-containing protein n=1 Tax=Candidatus Williamhamiltonella endosymbiont of Tuberolachnus salignus TaxID=3077954 RepID=UPI0030D3BCD4
MLIRVRGYNKGIKAYLEKGIKNGRDYGREELDERVILDGDLDLTEIIYQQIPDKGQDRYLTFTLSFRENEVSKELLNNITQEFREFFMYAYEDEEYHFYAEAHLPKIKAMKDKKTGKMIERKPHIHIVIPKKNVLSGKIGDPLGSHFSQSVKYLEAFQEYINQKYQLASPRDSIRVDPTQASDVLSRYKGDDFRSQHQSFKRQLICDVIEKNIRDREAFYGHVSSFGETKLRHKGKENEYISVKLPGEAKWTHLKETIFQDDFVVRREVKKPPLDKTIIRHRLCGWPQRAKEIKYVSKATPQFRQVYQLASPEEKIQLLAQRQTAFYEKYREIYDLYPAERKSDQQRSSAQTERERAACAPHGLQSVSCGDVATDRDSEYAENTVFLPGHAYVHLGQSTSGRSARLRSDLSAGGRRRGASGQPDFDRFTAVSGVPTVEDIARRQGFRIGDGLGGSPAGTLTLPPYARDLYRVATLEEIKQRGKRLFGASERPLKSNTLSSLRRLMPKPDKNASFLAAYFLRQHEQNSILPEHRQAIRAVDRQFFTARRPILSDNRLTRDEKTQSVSVLTFERLKAHEAIKQLEIAFKQERPDMGSADIRQKIKATRIPNPSLSGDTVEGAEIPPARARFARLIQHLSGHFTEKRLRDRQRRMSASDLYTKRAKLSKNVHYLDKKTDRTLFVDIGNAIAVRKGGMTDSAVAVALSLAKEKFGSTLTIKGSDDFKKQVIEVAVRDHLDVHFTDKVMNRQFEERKEERAIEREGQRVEEPTKSRDPDPEKASVDDEDPSLERTHDNNLGWQKKERHVEPSHPDEETEGPTLF